MTQKTHIRPGRRRVLAAAITVCGALACAKRTEPDAAPAGMREGKDMTAKIKSEGERVAIPGLSRLELDKGRDNQLMGALDVALRGVGEDAGYDHLMGVSGAAFRLHFWMPYWCPSSPDLMGGYDHLAPAMRAVGRDFEVMTVREDAASQEEAKAGIAKSIDSGRPVVANHLMGNGRYGVIAGYLTPDRTPLCRTYDDESDKYSVAKRLPVKLIVLGEKMTRPSRRQSVARSLRIAIELAHTNSYRRGGEDQASGSAAYEKWIGDLEDDAHFEKVEAEHGHEAVEGMADVNGWIYLALLDARAAASRYLKANAPVFDGEARRRITAAADIYEQITARLAEGRKYAPVPWDEEACAAWAGSPETRHAEAVVLREVLALETRAVAEIEKALAAARVMRERDQVRLEGLTHRGNWVSYMGTLVTCARFLDPDISEAWLWGTCGYAFSLSVHEQLCPSGPYMPVGKFDHLLPNIGLKMEKLSVESKAEGADENVDRMFDRTREAIEAGQPVMGWSLEHIDWYPIFGYDEKENYLFLRHNGQLGKYPHAKLGEKAPGGLALLSIIRPSPASDDAVAVRDALRFALRMGRGEYSHEAYTSGLDGYDVWIKAIEQPQDPPSDGTCFGHAFNAACWYECRRQAVTFLEEAKKRLADRSLSPRFDTAITHYRTVADQFRTLTELYPCQPGNNAPMRGRFEDAALRRKAVAALAAARTAEAEGLKVLAEIDKALGAGRTERDGIGD